MNIEDIVPQITPTNAPPIPMDMPETRLPLPAITDTVTDTKVKSEDMTLFEDAKNAMRRIKLDADQSDASREYARLANQVRSYGENETIPEELMTAYRGQKFIVDSISDEIGTLNNGKIVQAASSFYTSSREMIQDAGKHPLAISTGAAAGLAASVKVTAPLAGVPVLGVPLAATGVVASTLYGASTALNIASFKENKDRMAGEAYAEMDFAKDDQGNPLNIPNTVKNNLADMVGVIGATSEFAGDAIATKLFPIFKSLTGKVGGKALGNQISKYMTNEATRKGLIMLSSLTTDYSTAIATEAATEVFQEFMKDSAITGAKEGESDDSAITRALTGMGRMFDKLNSNTPEGKALKEKYKDTAIVAGLAGGMFHTAGRVASKVVTTAQDVASSKKISDLSEKIKNRTKRTTNIDGYAPTSTSDGIETAYKLDVLDQVLDQGGKKLSPKDELNLKVKLLEESGVTAMYADPAQLAKMLDTPLQRKILKEIFDKNKLDQGTGSKVSLTPEQVLTLMKDVKDLKKILTVDPAGLTFNEALALREQAKDKAALTLGSVAEQAPIVTEQDATALPALTSDLGSTDGINESAPNAGDTAAVLQYEQHKNQYITQLNDERASITSNVDENGNITRDAQIRLSEIDNMIQSLNQWSPEMDLATDETVALPEGDDVTDYERSQVLLQNHVDAPVITEFVKAGIPLKTFENITRLQKQAREQSVEYARMLQSKEYHQVLKAQTEMKNLEQELADIEAIKNDPDIQIVENFLSDRANNVISLESLTDEQKIKYGDDAVLKHRKVFNKKKGADINQVALNYGVSPDQLLHILQVTSDQKTAVKEAARLRKEALTEDVYATLDTDIKVIENHFDNQQKVVLAEMKAMSEMDFVGTARTVEAIMFTTPDMTSISVDVKNKVSKVKVSTLNPKKYRQAALIANRKALKAAQRGDLMKASKFKEMELRNLEFEKQSTIVVAKSNRLVKRLIKRNDNAYIVADVKRAGLEAAFDELSEMFNFNKKKVVSDQALEKYVKKVTKEEGNPMGVSLIENFSVTSNLEDLSLDQLEALNNLQSKIISDARRHQYQLKENKKLMISNIRDAISEKLKANRNYDAKRDAVTAEGETSPLFTVEVKGKKFTVQKNKLTKLTASLDASMANINHSINFLESGDQSGPMRRLMYDQLKGTGDYQNTGYGENSMQQLSNAMGDRINNITEEFGGAEYINYMNEEITDPILADTQGLLSHKGTVRRYELMALTAYAGMQEGSDRFKNYGLSRETVLTLAGKHLTKKDIQYIHKAWYDTFKLLQPHITKSQKDLNQVEVSFMDGQPFELFGETWEGGYVPFYYRKEKTTERQSRESREQVDAIVNLEPTVASQAMTREGFKKHRAKETDGLLTLNPSTFMTRGVLEIVTDVTMHVPIKNVMDIVSDVQVSNDIKAVIGDLGLGQLKANIMSSARNLQAENMRLQTEVDSDLTLAMNGMSRMFTRNTILATPSTVIMQTVSLPFLAKSVGFKGSGVALNTALKLLVSATKGKGLYGAEVARMANFDASTGELANQLQGKVFDESTIPEMTKDGEVKKNYNRFNRALNKLGFGYAIGSVDTFLKLVAFNTHISNFLNERGSDYDYSTVANLTPEERMNKAYAYAVSKVLQVIPSASNIETSTIQKGTFKEWVRFMGDARNQYSIITYDMNQVKNDAIDAYAAAKEGDVKKAAKHVGNLLKRYGYLNMTLATMYSMMAVIRGYNEEGEEVPAIMEDSQAYLEFMLTHWIGNVINPLTPLEAMTDALPFVRSAKFTLEGLNNTDGRYKPVIGDIPTVALNNLAEATYLIGKIAATSVRDYNDYGIFEVNMKESERRKILRGAGAILPIPYRAVEQLIQATPEEFNLGALSPMSLVTQVNQIKQDANKMVAENADNPNVDPEDIQALQDVLNQIDPQDTVKQGMVATGAMAVMSPEEFNLIAFAESNGNPNARAKNKDSSALGLYQYTKPIWQSLMDNYPELELTEDGRTDPEQAQRAFEFQARDFANSLMSKQLPVTVDNIYAMHHFGDTKALSILSKEDDELLPSLTREREYNPWLDGRVSWVNEGKRVNTVGEFRQAISDLLRNRK